MSDYPSVEELERIRLWPVLDWPSRNAEGLSDWFKFIRSVGHYWSPYWNCAESWGWEEDIVEPGPWLPGTFLPPPVTRVRRYYISTGGWSGNESILTAMQANRVAWNCTWQASRVGGHYIFQIPEAG